jgi:cell division topological specificity factor MinE
MGFDYIVCDSPAGIEKGAQMAMYFADEAIVVCNPEVSSVRDADRVIGLLAAKTNRAETNNPIRTHLLLTRYSPMQVKKGEMLSVDDVPRAARRPPPRASSPSRRSCLLSSNKGTPACSTRPTTSPRPTWTSSTASPARSASTGSSRREAGHLPAAVRLRRRGHGSLRIGRRLLPADPKTASIAKDRLSVIVARERASTRGGADYLPQLQQELLAVLAKYENIDLQHVSVKLDKTGDCEVLELNITLPEQFWRQEGPRGRLKAPSVATNSPGRPGAQGFFVLRTAKRFLHFERSATVRLPERSRQGQVTYASYECAVRFFGLDLNGFVPGRRLRLYFAHVHRKRFHRAGVGAGVGSRGRSPTAKGNVDG